MISNLESLVIGTTPPQTLFKNVSGNLVSGRPFTPFYTAGIPGAAVAPTPGITGVVLTSYAGQIPFTNPASGNTYLAKFGAMVDQTGILHLCDRLWHNSGITITSNTEQTFTSSVQIPARDLNGTNNGVGVYAGVEVSSTTGAGTPTLTLKYTNSNGVANKTGTNKVPTVASSATGTFYPISLADGDLGIQKAQSLTLSATWTSGTIHVVLYRIIASLNITTPLGGNYLDFYNGLLPVYDNTVPFLIFVPNTTSTSYIRANVVFTQG